MQETDDDHDQRAHGAQLQAIGPVSLFFLHAPVSRQEIADQCPSDGGPNEDGAGFYARLFQVGEHDSVDQWNRRRVAEGIEEHRPEDAAERLLPRRHEEQQRAQQMARHQNPLRIDHRIGQLPGNRRGDHAGQRQGRIDPTGLLAAELHRTEQTCREDRHPRAPNGILEKHHQADDDVHGRIHDQFSFKCACAKFVRLEWGDPVSPHNSEGRPS